MTSTPGYSPLAFRYRCLVVYKRPGSLPESKNQLPFDETPPDADLETRHVSPD